ncbi:MAG TPA: ATP-binding protein [Candidatus Dormibacteraeota bacterium]|jgi:signal transduction histidine kinase/CheY-like chemotaxis protein
MRILAESLGYAVAAGFLLLAIRALIDLWRRRERREAYLALAIGGLAVLALASQVELAYPPIAVAAGQLAQISLMASAYALLLFRATFIPLRRATKITVGAAVVVATIVGAVGPSLAGSIAPLQLVAALAPIVVWFICAAEPTIRFWIAARRRPAVQRSRLRSLSFGYGAIVLILLLSLTGAAGTSTESGLRIVALMWTIALGVLPLLYMAFWPPRWLRGRWRRAEEASFRGALQGLLLAETREQAATAVVEWGMRLVGAGAGALVAEGRPLASAGLSAADADSMAAELEPQTWPRSSVLELRDERLYLTLLPATGESSALLVLLPGDFSPIFGADEMESLRQFGVPATAALERLKLISDLTQANSAKREFLSRMSHELRTPLNSVLGFSQLLATELTDPKHTRQVGHINQAGTHLLALINDILDLSRIEAGQLSVSLEPVSVACSVQQAVDLISPLADKRGVIVEVDLGREEQFVLADAGRLAQVLINLLSNAVKYNHESGRIRVYCESASAGRVRVHVADTGIGIELADQDLVFEPFVRVNAGRSAVEGTGIGLSLSKALAELMNGNLGFTSRSDEGSDFWIELPEAEAPGLAPGHQSKPDVHLAMTVSKQGALVLYIEGNRANAELVSAIVDRLEGVRLQVAATGEDGLNLARSERPDIIFLDQHLPDISGLEVLGRLRLDPATRRTPVVMISADVALAVEPGSFPGAQAFLTKPLDVTSVVSAIDQAMRPAAAGTTGEPVAVTR